MNSAWHRQIHKLRQRDLNKNDASWVGRESSVPVLSWLPSRKKGKVSFRASHSLMGHDRQRLSGTSRVLWGEAFGSTLLATVILLVLDLIKWEAIWALAIKFSLLPASWQWIEWATSSSWCFHLCHNGLLQLETEKTFAMKVAFFTVLPKQKEKKLRQDEDNSRRLEDHICTYMVVTASECS